MARASVELVNVSYWYPGSSKPALRDINLKIGRGEFVVITGPTGAGKTTLAYILNGTIPHFIKGGRLEGKIIVDGVNTKENPIPIIAQKVGLVFDDPEIQAFGLTVWDTVVFGPCNLGLPLSEVKRRARFALESTMLLGYERRNPIELSGGEKQRVAIAGALSMLPSILVFDEATAMLDPIGRSQVYEVAKYLNEKHRITIIMITQILGEVAELADRIIVLNNGEIVEEGETNEILSNYNVIREASLRPPQIIEFFYKLKSNGVLELNTIPASILEAKKLLKKILNSTPKPIALPHKRRLKFEEPLIIVEDVHYVYPSGQTALRGVSLRISEGEFIGVIGQNGSGKTTLAKHLNGLLKPSRGRVIVGGVDTRNTSVSKLARIVGYVYQNPDIMLFKPTVWEEIAFGPRNLGLSDGEVDKRVREAIRALGLEGYEEKPPSSLPRGLRKRVALASILSMKPKVIIADEPNVGQDWVESLMVMEALKEANRRGTTIMVITHDVELIAMFAERIIVMVDGKIIADASTREVFTNKSILEEASLKLPQITMLFEDQGFHPITVSEALEIVEYCRGEPRGSRI